MPKHYSSLQNLAKNSGTPYGVKTDNASNSNTFNLPSVIETIPSSKSRGGKSIHDYVTNPQPSSMPGAGCNPKYIQITSGEYSLGSIEIGQYAADTFKTNNGGGWPVCIRVDKGTRDGLNQSNNNTTYDEVSYISDVTGDSLAASAVLLQGTDVLPNDSAFILVYQGHGGTIGLHAQERTIRVAWSVGGFSVTKDFQVILPGVQNTVGWGDSMASMAQLNHNGPGETSYNIDCSPVTSLKNANSVHFHGHNFSGAGQNVYLYGASSAFFVGAGPVGAGNTGFANLHVTRLGQHHDNAGLWNEGFQPTDGSFQTNAHQETWPVGLFYDLVSPSNERTILRSYTSATGMNFETIQDFYNKQYNGSALINTTHPAINTGSPLTADSVQHYEYIQTYLVNDSAKSTNHPKDYLNQIENSQINIASTSNSSTNTADDNGTNFGIIKGELIAGSGSILYDVNNSINSTPTGGTDGMIVDASGENHVPTFQHIQIYSENLACSCGGSSGGSIPIDMCTNPNNPSYYLYTGVDCTGAAIPVGLMNGTETWGPNGSTGYTYELVASPTCTSCGCSGALSVYNPSASSAVPVPDFSLTNINAPTTLGGNDGWADIEINPALSGSEAWVYFVEPLDNTNAGLGVGAIHSATIVSGGSGGTNGMVQYEYTSGSIAGFGAKVEVEVTGGVVTTLDAILKRGQDYEPGEILTFTSTLSAHTFTLQVQNVRGVVVSIQGTGTSNGTGTWWENPHEGTGTDATFSNGLKATIGTNVVLAHVGGSATTNNYGKAPHLLAPSAVNNVPGLPFKRVDFFDDLPFDTTTANNTVITGMESGQYLVTVQEGTTWEPANRTYGCFTQETLVIPPGVASTNGCTDNDAGTNDGAALNYDANATVDDDSCIYCRAADGKLVDFQSNELTVSGSNEPGDIFTSTNNSTTVASTTSVATDGSIAYTRTLNSIMNYYTGQIVDANGTANAEFKMELYKRTSSTQTLTGASQVGATVTTPTNVGFNYDFDSTNFSQGLTYGYYAVKSYVNDPDSASEQEQCFQVDYFIVPVLACITGVPGMQVGITTDNVTITDLDLVVSSIPGNNLNPCSTQCCDDPTSFVHYIQNSSIPGCADPTFNVDQTCPAGNNQYITVITSEVQMLINGVWTTISSFTDTTPGPYSQNNIGQMAYSIAMYHQHGPGDYRVNRILDYTWPNGTTSQCQGYTNVMTLNAPVCGCTDPNSLNHNPLATIDDGSCTYCVDGCMDPNATNYNSLATCPAPCTFCIYGCMDPAANNYNSAATCDDGSCQYGVGCGCTDILADNYGEDCGGNIVGYPPPCDDGCCSYGGAFCANPPNTSTVTTESTCDPACGPGAIGCTANLNGVAGGPGYFSIDLDFGTDKGVCILTFNTGISVPDKLGWSFDIDNSGIQTTRSEQSALVGGYLTGLTGTADVPAHGCADCSGYATPQTVTEYVYSASSGNFVSTNSTVNLPAYGGNSTGDVTLSDWAVAGVAVPNKGDTPNSLVVFNEDGYVNKNSIAYIPVSPSTTATTAKVFVEAPCSSTNWYLTIRCPELLTGISSSVSAGVGGDPSSLGLTTTIYHIPIDANGAGNPNSAYWNGTGLGTGQQAGTLGKHDWVFTDPHGVNKLPAGNYLMESPVGSGITWDVTVGVPTYNDDANCAAPPSGSTQEGVVLMMETTVPATPCPGTTAISDSAFETLLIGQSLDSGTVDGSVLNTNICNVTNLNISTGYIIDCNNFGSVTNLTGIEGFQSIEFLGIMGHPITTIDVTNNVTLKEIQASWTLFTNINLSTLSQLESFDKLGSNYSATCQVPASGTKTLATIVLPNPSVMNNLEVSINKLTTLTLDNQTSMTVCRAKENLLTSIDTSGATALNLLDCSDNQLTSLDVSNNTALTHLNCKNNQLTSIDLGDTIDLVTLTSQSGGIYVFDAKNNSTSLVIKVGSISRKAQAQALFIVGTHIDATTTFSEL